MIDFDKLTVKYKIDYVRKHRGPVTITDVNGTDYVLEFCEADGDIRKLQDNDFDSLINRAYCITEGEVRSWGY